MDLRVSIQGLKTGSRSARQSTGNDPARILERRASSDASLCWREPMAISNFEKLTEFSKIRGLDRPKPRVELIEFNPARPAERQNLVVKFSGLSFRKDDGWVTNRDAAGIIMKRLAGAAGAWRDQDFELVEKLQCPLFLAVLGGHFLFSNYFDRRCQSNLIVRPV